MGKISKVKNSFTQVKKEVTNLKRELDHFKVERKNPKYNAAKKMAALQTQTRKCNASAKFFSTKLRDILIGDLDVTLYSLQTTLDELKEAQTSLWVPAIQSNLEQLESFGTHLPSLLDKLDTVENMLSSVNDDDKDVPSTSKVSQSLSSEDDKEVIPPTLESQEGSAKTQEDFSTDDDDDDLQAVFALNEEN